MTACVNNDQKKEGSAYGKAVKATLAATLAVGMVPAVALAAEAPEVEGDISLASVSPEVAFKAGKVTAAVDNEDNVIADLENVKFAADGEAHFVVPTEFTPEESIAIDVTDEKEYEFEYYALDEDGEKTGVAIDADQLTKPGAYGVVVKSVDGTFESDVAATFTIVSASLSGATLFEVGEDEGDVSDTTFVYTGEELDLGLALDGEALTVNDDYTVTYYQVGGGTATVQNAGKYIAQVKGTGIYAGQTKSITFTVDKFDLSAAQIAIDPANLGTSTPTVTSIEGVELTKITGAYEVEVVGVPDSFYGGNKLGVYQVSVAATKDAANVTGAQTLDVVKYGQDATFKYGDEALKTTYATNYSDKKPEVFDLSEIAAYDASGEELEDAKLDIVVKDAKGNVVDNSSVTKPGVWTVLVSLDAASTKYEYGGQAAAITVTVKDGDVAGDADVFVKYAGEVVDEKDLVYTGEDLYKNVSVVVKVDDKVLVAGEDYEVALTQEVEGKYVAADAMIDAGNYKVTVTGKDYVFDAEQIVQFTVKPMTATSVKFATPTIDLGKGEVVPYTGEAIVPEFVYTTAEDPMAEDAEYVALLSGMYEIAGIEFEGEEVEQILEPGEYTVTLADNEEDPMAEDAEYVALLSGMYEIAGIEFEGEEVEQILEPGEYTVTLADNEKDVNFEFDCNLEFTITVSDDPVYSDVPVNEWFTTYVYDASKAGYMTGIGGTDLFAPSNATTRAMAATVLYRMAGHNEWFTTYVYDASKAGYMTGIGGTDLFAPSNATTRAMAATVLYRMAGQDDFDGIAPGYVSPFVDVLSYEWFADEVLWANEVGIVTGDTGLAKRTFRPNDNVTRQDFCLMMMRYANATGQGIALEDGEAATILAEFPDADAVADYAAQGVAWAVKNGLFGGAGVLNPSADISRAEMAKMVTVFQPEAL